MSDLHALQNESSVHYYLLYGNICTNISHICPPKRDDIYVKYHGHICFWLNTMHNFINGFERAETKEAANG